jgi:hypothetical protein
MIEGGRAGPRRRLSETVARERRDGSAELLVLAGEKLV